MSRFTLYCLDDGDEYFGDCIADYVPPCSSTSTFRASSMSPPHGQLNQRARSLPLSSSSADRQKYRGRLRLAGRGLFFQPDDVSVPIFSFRFRQMNLEDVKFLSGQQTTEAAAESTTTTTTTRSTTTSGKYFSFKCRSVATQRVNCEVGPYGELTYGEDDVHEFCLPFAREKRLSSSALRFWEDLNALLSAERSADADTKLRVVAEMVEVKSRETPFSLTLLQSAEEDIIRRASCRRICPLTAERGRIVITTKCLYFQSIFPLNPPGVITMPLKDVRRVERRRSRFLDIGIEIALLDGTVMLFAFETPQEREASIRSIVDHPLLDRLKINCLESMVRRWRVGAISTFDYLMYLNWAAGRSLNDLAQYVVIPWTISDFTSTTLDLSDEKCYRDLSKPVGALNEARLLAYWRRMQHLKEVGEEPYLYGTHYSNPAYVTYFLVREHPEYVLVLQGGKLDHPSRTFESVAECWNSVSTCATDLKELVPQFYFGDGRFLARSLDLGMKNDGTNVRREVRLPPWADSPQDFVAKLRAALEGSYVSRNIHHWIDLIFGFQQHGTEAWKAHNVFHPFSYESCIEKLQSMAPDDVQRQAMEAHIREFGQVPKQLFSSPHPPRLCVETPSDKISLTTFLPPDSEEFASAQQLECASGQRVTPTTSQEAVPHAADAPPPRNIFALYPAHGDNEEAELSHLLTHVEELSALKEPPPVQTLSLTPPMVVAEAAQQERQSTARTLRINGPQMSFKMSAKQIDAIAVCRVTHSACNWILDLNEGETRPIAFVSEGDGNVNVFDLASHRKLRVLPKLFGLAAIRSLCATPTQDYIFLGSLNGTAYTLEVSSCNCVHEMEVSNMGITALCHLPMRQLLVSGGQDGTARFWVVESGPDGSSSRLRRQGLLDVNGEGRVVSVATDTNETTCLVATADDQILLVDLETMSVTVEADIAHLWGGDCRHEPVLLAFFITTRVVCVVKRSCVLSVELDAEEDAKVVSHFAALFPIGAATLTDASGLLPSLHLCVAAEDCASVAIVHPQSGVVVCETSTIPSGGGDARSTAVAVAQGFILIGDSVGHTTVIDTFS